MKATGNVATPFTSGAEPSWMAPSRKVTSPVGVPPACELTVAVRVTPSASSAGLGTAETTVEDANGTYAPN